MPLLVSHFYFFLKIYKIVKFPQDARWLELSVCYHTPTSHFHTPPFLSSYHKHLTHSLESTTYSIPPCHHGINSVAPSRKPLTHLICSVSLPNPAPLPKQKISSPSAQSLWCYPLFSLLLANSDALPLQQHLWVPNKKIVGCWEYKMPCQLFLSGNTKS